jgi:predicted transcriptional regulator
MDAKLLTPLELKVMNILWAEKKVFVRDIVARWPEEPGPAYNTISTIVRILEEKGFVGHESIGRGHAYYPLIQRKGYQKRLLQNVIDNVFAGSMTGLMSTLLEQRKVSAEELETLKRMIDESEEG